MTAPGSVAESWCFVSGRCAVLEASLLGSDFFREMLRDGTAEGAYVRISKTVYAEIFPHPRALREYDPALTNRLRGELLALRADSPRGGPAELFLAELELREVHGVLNRQGMARETAAEVERWAERLGAGFPWMEGFSIEGETRALFASQPIRALSLWADAAYLLRAGRIAEVEPGLAGYARALVSLRAAAVCWRAARSGLDARWLAAFFFRNGMRPPAAKDLSSAAKEASPLGMIRIFGPADFPSPGDDFQNTFGRDIDDYLTRVAARGRYDVYGPGRVLHYARQMWIEHFNMRLCLAAVITPLPAAQAMARLRSG